MCCRLSPQATDTKLMACTTNRLTLITRKEMGLSVLPCPAVPSHVPGPLFALLRFLRHPIPLLAVLEAIGRDIKDLMHHGIELQMVQETTLNTFIQNHTQIVTGGSNQFTSSPQTFS